jgi:rubrerythrin
VDISKRQLRDLTDEVDQLHQEGMRTLDQQLGDAHLDLSREAARRSRRRFLAGSVVGGAALTAAAAVGPASLLPGVAAQDGPSKFPSPDEKIIGVAQEMEKSLVQIYTAVVARITDPTVTDTVNLFKAQHDDHATALGKVLKQSEGQTAKVGDFTSFTSTYQSQITPGTSQEQALQVAYQAELAAAATYLQSLERLTVGFNAGSVSTILPVESQHAAVLATILNLPIDTVLPAEIPTDGAIDLSSPSVQSAATTTTTTAPTDTSATDTSSASDSSTTSS